MKPSAIRSELLRQHDGLRERMTTVRTAAERCTRGEDGLEELRRTLTLLTDAVRTHNAHEERLMSKVFPELDAWGPVRHEVMNEEHALEHEKLVTALISAHNEPDPKVAAKVATLLLESMTEHMEREEKVFLGPDVLSDEEPPPDAFGG